MSIFDLGLGYFAIESSHEGIGWTLIWIGAIELFGVPYFWQQRNDRDEDWR
jgi:hypothetical protein